MKLKNIQDVKDLKGKRVLLRATLNVPVKEGKVTNDFRLRRTLKTIRFLQEESAKIIMIGHIGRDASLSLYPVYEYFKKYLPISFAHEIFGEKTNIALNKIKNGENIIIYGDGSQTMDLIHADDISRANILQ